MAESVQRIIVRRALSGQYPQTQEQIIEWLEQTVTGWNQDPTPFVWNGKRRERRQRAQLKRLAGSGAAIRSYASSLEIDPLSGFLGCATFAGDLAPFLELLIWGELIHVGKSCVKGNGWYRIENSA